MVRKSPSKSVKKRAFHSATSTVTSSDFEKVTGARKAWRTDPMLSVHIPKDLRARIRIKSLNISFSTLISVLGRSLKHLPKKIFSRSMIGR